MFYVYVLWSREDNKFYAGFTNNLDRRIGEHKAGGNYTTVRFRNPKLIYYKAFSHEKDARRREKYFKTTKGKKTLKLMLRDGLAM